MNREEIIRMAREAGEAEGMVELIFHPVLERFAALVAAAEREACINLCYSIDTKGEVEESDITGWQLGTIHCAAAIRARGKA